MCEETNHRVTQRCLTAAWIRRSGIGFHQIAKPCSWLAACERGRKSKSCCCGSGLILILVIPYFKWNSHPIICPLRERLSVSASPPRQRTVSLSVKYLHSPLLRSKISLWTLTVNWVIFVEKRICSSQQQIGLPSANYPSYTQHPGIFFVEKKWHKLLCYITRRLKETGLSTSGSFIHIWQKLLWLFHLP